MLTPSQIEQLNKIIDRKVYSFIAKNFTVDQLTPEQKKALISVGVQIEKIKPSDLIVYQSFALGLISGAVPKSTLNATTYNAFKSYLDSGKFIPLNSYEKAVISSLERQSLSDIVGIGNKYKKTVGDALITSERKYYEDTIRNNITEGRAKKESLRVISNNISKELGDFGRNFDKVVQTVSHNAFIEGREAFFVRNYGKDAKFFVDVFEGACSWCVSSYLTGGLGSEPKAFKVGQLPPPETNYGKKKADWVVTKPSSHPFCRCTTHSLPDGYVWNPETKQFEPSKDFKRKVERKSKVKIQFGDKNYEI